MKTYHIYTSEYKIENFGYGEWVEEPDLVYFHHAGFICKIERNYCGALWGYVRIPKSHPWYDKNYDDIDCEVHGGLTYSKQEKNLFYVGFNCDHDWDYVPCVEKHKKRQRLRNDSQIKQLVEQLGTDDVLYRKIYGFDKDYRNLAYVVDECKKLAEQAREQALVKNEN